MKIVISGVAGSIGANIGEELLARPEVTSVVALDEGVRDSKADPSRLIRHFLEVEPVSLQNGLASTVERFRSQSLHHG